MPTARGRPAVRRRLAVGFGVLPGTLPGALGLIVPTAVRKAQSSGAALRTDRAEHAPVQRHAINFCRSSRNRSIAGRDVAEGARQVFSRDVKPQFEPWPAAVDRPIGFGESKLRGKSEIALVEPRPKG